MGGQLAHRSEESRGSPQATPSPPQHEVLCHDEGHAQGSLLHTLQHASQQLCLDIALGADSRCDGGRLVSISATAVTCTDTR